MQKRIKNPSVSLQTLVIVIQLLQTEIEEYKVSLKKKAKPEDYLWLEDLETAALELKESYISFILKHKIINFPTYEKLIKQTIDLTP
jgi:FtsZ-binding cell division protein ZapB